MNRSVLIVDDEPSICKALQRTLKRHHITVYQANGGEDALKLLATTTVDCIVSDQRMPGMKGTEFLGIARQQFPDIGRIILSGQSDLNDLEDAINIAGVRQFISKPWDDNQLLNAVNEVIAPVAEPAVMDPEPTLSVVAKAPNDGQKTLQSTSQVADISLHLALERAIKNDALALIVDDYCSLSCQRQNMLSLRVHWPDQPSMSQDEIVKLANEAGFGKTLMTWYLLQVLSYSGLSAQPQVFVVDLFDVSLLASQSLRKFLSLSLKFSHSFLLKIDLPSFQQGLHEAHLLPLIQEHPGRCGLLVDIGQRMMNLDDLRQQAVNAIAMSGQESVVNNEIVSYQRRQLMAEAAKFSIKTILSDGSLRLQRHYANTMQFDYIRAPE